MSEKVDHLLVQQNKKLLEIQEVQIDYLEDVLKEKMKLENRKQKAVPWMPVRFLLFVMFNQQ